MPRALFADPAPYLRPDAARILAFADRLDAAGDRALARLARRAADGLGTARPPTSRRGPLPPLTSARWA